MSLFIYCAGAAERRACDGLSQEEKGMTQTLMKLRQMLSKLRVLGMSSTAQRILESSGALKNALESTGQREAM